MNWILRQPRTWFLFVAIACASLIGFALYKQHMDFVDPCPLCVFQRLAFMWIGAVSLVAALHGPGPAGLRVYGAGVILGGLTGAGIAGRHLWLQNLPPDQVPDCGMGLNYMLDTMPFTEVLAQVFMGSGECAEVLWTFMGLSMPGWTLVWYSGITIVTIFVLVKANATKA
jgi:disulfide bond formation protein DsbB